MNSNDQFEATSFQQTQHEFSENVHTISAESSVSDARKYLRVDLEKGELSFTFDKRLASSLKAIHTFVMLHSDKLTCDVLDHFLNVGLHHFIKHKSGFFSPLFNKIKSCNSFIVNRGKTDKKLIKEIYEEIQMKFNDELEQQMECNRLKDKINCILSLKNALEENVNNKKSPLSPEMITKNIKRITERLLAYRKAICSEESQQQIATILKAIQPHPEDSLILRECKKQFKEDNKKALRIMKNQNLRFDPMVEIKFIFDEENESQTMKLPIILSDRVMSRSDGNDLGGYYLRGPSDLSIHQFAVDHFEVESKLKQRIL
ncbi:MAG: hypothetical protein ACH350_09890 [Parachlamydiaceae bacterium]